MQVEPWQDDDECGLKYDKGEDKAAVDGRKAGLIMKQVDHLHDKEDKGPNAKNECANADGESLLL